MKEMLFVLGKFSISPDFRTITYAPVDKDGSEYAARMHMSLHVLYLMMKRLLPESISAEIAKYPAIQDAYNHWIDTIPQPLDVGTVEKFTDLCALHVVNFERIDRSEEHTSEL